MARLVNKQFNSPIGLYSEQNIREVIQRESQILSNGAVGINFNNPTVGKPSNLQNSAVLRMLEEEEQRQRSGQAPSAGYDRPLRDQIKWPPTDFVEKNLHRSSFKDVVTPGLKRVAWPPPNEGENYEQPQPEGGPQYSSQSPTLQNNYTPVQQVPQNPSQRTPPQALNISNGTNYPSATSSLASHSPLGFQPAVQSKRWAPVQSPTHAPPSQQYQAPPSQQYQAPPSQQYQTPPPQQYQAPLSNQYQPPPSQQYQPTQAQNKPSVQTVAATNQTTPYSRPVEPPPTTITLRPQAPVSQAPPPVVTSQPATATLKGGKHLRGDLKWPPENVKRQVEEENRQRVELAKGPAFRPRAAHKDYGPFFAQHALNASYPGYKAPPGTQFYEHRPMY